MTYNHYYFTSESVSEGHPDKMADQISDVILDSFLEKDPQSRVACETMIPSKMVIIGGEITSSAKVNIPETIRKKIKDIGYDSEEKGFDYKTCKILLSLNPQSLDIAKGILSERNKRKKHKSFHSSEGETLKAGDQGLMFGYAIKETKEYMPLTIILSHELMSELTRFRKQEKKDFLWPDAKGQVTVEYENNVPKRVQSIVISTQHSPAVSQKDLKAFILDEFLKKIRSSLKDWVDGNTKVIVNPTGRFVIGGPQADCGLTGRKIIMDTYGGHGSHGGGAFSGKDPTKVDRSGAYAARHIAKNVVASKLVDRLLVQVAYVIGMSKPISLMIEDYGTSRVKKEILLEAIQRVWNLEPSNIISSFDLLKPRYSKTATYGHFGRNEKEFTWERLDKVDVFKDTVRTLTQSSFHARSVHP